MVNWESDLISSPRSTSLTIGTLGDPSAILKELSPVLAGEYDLIRNSLIGLAEKAKTNREAVQKDWTEACRQRAEFRHYTDQQQSVYGFNFDAGKPPAFKPDPFDVALLIWGGAVLLVALRLRGLERRLANRKAARTALMATLLIGLALPGCEGSSGDSRPWADREQTELTTAIKDATEKADAATNVANARWQATVDGWAKLVTAPKESVDALVQREEIGESGKDGFRDRVRAIAIEAHLAELIVKDTEDLRNKVAEERAKLEDLVAGAKWRAIAFTYCSNRHRRVPVRHRHRPILVWPGCSSAWRGRLASRTCPRCFRRDTLKVEKTSSVSESKPSYRGGKVKPKAKVEPDAEEADEDTEALCTKCGLRMRRSYLTVPRLCFPTVGVRASGKTHMLVTAYDRIRKRTAPTAAIVQPAPSGSDIDKRFDRLIDEILHRRGEAGATDLALPDPILVHLKDCDPAGGIPALINLFDYSGEMINPDVDVHQLKSTAVRMDGFMLFLDPTQLYGDGANVTLDEQLGMLDQFLAHMRKERKIPVGEPIPIPVAVCITKFDLLPTDNPIGGQSVPFIRHLLDTLNPPPRETTLEVIQLQRSDSRLRRCFL